MQSTHARAYEMHCFGLVYAALCSSFKSEMYFCVCVCVCAASAGRKRSAPGCACILDSQRMRHAVESRRLKHLARRSSGAGAADAAIINKTLHPPPSRTHTPGSCWCVHCAKITNYMMCITHVTHLTARVPIQSINNA